MKEFLAPLPPEVKDGLITVLAKLLSRASVTGEVGPPASPEIILLAALGTLPGVAIINLSDVAAAEAAAQAINKAMN